ncbi:discoidin domain-containing protein [Paractinoplanes ferrugineus]|uniref:discoidin domain-containing protein n=1 Tax=Paractinoplanes ferrugineus TaxID=113564 RepID=UPI00194539B6|nr:discoidin domain-containing protein [Actinoplanes ferrugineus]
MFAASPRAGQPAEFTSRDLRRHAGGTQAPNTPAARTPQPRTAKPGPGTPLFYNALPERTTSPVPGPATPARPGRRLWLVPVVAGALLVGAVAGGVAVHLDRSTRSTGAERDISADRPAAPGASAPGASVAAPSNATAVPSAEKPPAAAPPAAASSAASPEPGSPSASASAPGKTAARPNPTGANLALRKTATTSSVESDSWPAADAVDGDMSSRWSSGWTDPQWIKVDLGAVWAISDVRLAWEHAYALSYRVDVSLDAHRWTTVYRTTAGTNGPRDIHLSATPARYVRLYGTKRASKYGYSLQEFEVR